MKASVIKFETKFWVEDSSFILLKRDSTRGNFFKFLEMRFIPLKKKKNKRPVA